MSDTKWTPGPWLVNKNHSSAADSAYEVVTSARSSAHPSWPNCYVAETIGGIANKSQKANAHLIAAAPMLYEALETALAKLREYADQDGIASGHGAGCMTDPDSFISDAEEKAEAALAAARGEQS